MHEIQYAHTIAFAISTYNAYHLHEVGQIILRHELLRLLAKPCIGSLVNASARFRSNGANDHDLPQLSLLSPLPLVHSKTSRNMFSQNAQTLHFSGIQIDMKQHAQAERVTNDDDRHRIRSARKHTPEVPGFCPSMGAVGLTVTASGSEPPRRCLAGTHITLSNSPATVCKRETRHCEHKSRIGTCYLPRS